MPDRLDFDSARDLIGEIAPTDTWDDAVQRAADPLMVLDTDDSTERGRRRPSNRWLVAVAACLLAVVVLAAVVAAERQSVDTAPPADSPTTDCPAGACGDGPTTIAKGEDIALVGSDPDSLGGQTLQIDVQEEDGEVTGEFVVTSIVNTVECVDTDTDGFVVLGARVTTTDPDVELAPAVGDLQALIIQEGDPDRVSLFANDAGAETCDELLESIPADLFTGGGDFVKLDGDDDIETG
jgi:hypothetical protein